MIIIIMSIICIDSETEAYTECPTATQSRVIINWIDHDTANTIDISIPEEFSRDYSWSWDTIYIEISWYNVDNQYIQDVLANTRMTPTNEDFATLIQWTQTLIPYIFIGMITLFALYLVKKLFRW